MIGKICMKGSEFMTKIKQIIYVSVFAMLFLMGCGADRPDTATAYDSVIKNEGWRIQEACSEITEEMAEKIYQDVLKLKQDLRKGIYTVENSRIVFLKEERKGNEVTVRAVFESDETSVRKPKDHPLIQGMYEAKDKLVTDAQKEAAETYIQGWLAELEPEYGKTYRLSHDIVVKFDMENRMGYQLYYPFIKESNEISESSEQPEETLEPFEQYAADHWKENVEEQRQIGRERILEAAGA